MIKMTKSKLGLLFVVSLVVVGILAIGVAADHYGDQCTGHYDGIFCFPEFTTIGAGLAALCGLAGYTILRRKRKQI
jgi:uncharacterized membrane protein YdcZ (DUF606 family)